MPELRVAGPGQLTGPWVNRLVSEPSLYLRQHAHNPVDWYPWGEEAFALARARDVPIFLSIGYSACHWCHVMERESFEDARVAAYLNERFVSVKVDREERPAVDALYIGALMAMGQPAGWPASLWLDHDRLAFYGGTYFPPVYRYGTPAFSQILQTIADSWERSRDSQRRTALRVRDQLAALPQPGGRPSPAQVEAAVDELDRAWDEEHKGWGEGAKFPMPPNLELLLTHGLLRGRSDCLGKVEDMLEAMDRGGLHDHLGGGFHRYTVDPEWGTPHFEKMLYDNAQLLRLYAEAASALGRPRYREVARGIVGWLMREMRAPGGGFYASQDADSDGGEGAFYSWSLEEVRALLPARQAARFARAYSVEQWGDFEGRSVLRWRADDPGAPELRAARARLLAARRERPAPATDTKRVVAWNGLAVGALARAGRLLRQRAWVMAAEETAAALLAARGSDGALPRTLPDTLSHPSGRTAPPPGGLRDHAYVIEGLLDLHEATLEGRWLAAAMDLTRVMIARFFDPESGLFFRTPAADDPAAGQAAAAVPVRLVDLRDGAEPGGGGRALEALRRLVHLGAAELNERYEQALEAACGPLEAEPAAHADVAAVLDRELAGAVEVVISALDPAEAAALAAPYHERWRPAALLAARGEQAPVELGAFRSRPPRADGARAYVCRAGACGLPARSPAELRDQLAAISAVDTTP